MENPEKKEEKYLQFEKGKIYFFMSFSLVCGGKSTFFEEIKAQTGKENEKEKYNIILVSSDKIREELSLKMQKDNPKMTFKQCFDKVGRDTAKEFDTQIKNAIDSADKDKINIILVDKNYPQGIKKFLEKFCTDKDSMFFIVFIPNIKKPININNIKFPFSLNYFIQCYLRLKNRHGHEVLNGEDESSKYVYISFLKLFQNFDFDKRLKSSEEYGKNIFFQIIDFTDEKNEIQIETNTEKFFNNVMRKIKPFDEFSIKKYFGNDIDEYFKAIEEKYDGKNFFEDTRELIKNEIEDLLKNGVMFDK
jgi:vacuolar-type H+-ATPase subunit F/Vma7